MNNDKPHVMITNPNHPHYNEVGYLTGEMIQTAGGTVMVKVDLGGGHACFVQRKDFKEI